MERRITRAMAAKEAAMLAELSRKAIPQLPIATLPAKITTIPKRAGVKRKGQSKDIAFKKAEIPPMTRSRVTRIKTKRDRIVAIPQSDVSELPHNLGKIHSSITAVSHTATAITMIGTQEAQEPKAVIRGDEASKFKVEIQETSNSANNTSKRHRQAKKPDKVYPYGLTPGVSPFPQWDHPTPTECEEVNKLLSSVHGEVNFPAIVPEPSLTVTGCGEVPSVLDALIRTLLSGATTGNNSAMAFQGLVKRFGISQGGIGKGSVDWNAVRHAGIGEVYEAMKSGGLATTKSKYIKEILDMVYEENTQRRDFLLKARGEDITGPIRVEKSDAAEPREIDCANEHVLSLDYIHGLGKEEAMLELVKYPGIGPKTAACVLLFCLQRPCFAVDTHIFRICKWLGWIPSEKVNEITAFSHLEVHIPDHLKYSLHQLLIRHGKSCPRCRAITGEKSDGWDQGCAIDHLVRRTGKRKGNGERAISGEIGHKSKKAKRIQRQNPVKENNNSEIDEVTNGE